MATPNFNFFTGSEGLRTMYRETNQINCKFIEFNIPFTDSGGRVSFNTGGKTRILTVQGAHDGKNFTGADREAQILSFITAMEVWVNNNGEQSKQVYSDTFGQTFTVDAIDWQWTRSNSDPNRIIYSIVMRETI